MKAAKIVVQAPPQWILWKDACAVCGRPTSHLYGPPGQPRHERRCKAHKPEWAQ